jgi:carbamoyl-phosphate synthase large subunit
MKSTGEVMGIGENFAEAFGKAEVAASFKIPDAGFIVITVADFAKQAILPIAGSLISLGFQLIATKGTASFLQDNGVAVSQTIAKVSEDSRDNVVEFINSNEVRLLINVPNGSTKAQTDGYQTRKAALERHVFVVTSLPAIKAIVASMQESRERRQVVRSLQSQ